MWIRPHKTKCRRSQTPTVWRSFSKISFFQIVLRPHENAQPAFSNSSGLKSVLKKFRFLDRLRMDGRPNQRNKATFLNSSARVQCLGSQIFWFQTKYAVLLMGLWLWISWLLISKHFFARFLVFNWWPTHVLLLHTLYSCRDRWKGKPLLLRGSYFAKTFMNRKNIYCLHRFSKFFCITFNFHCCMTISRRRAIHVDTRK